MKDPLQSCLLLTQLEGEIVCLALVGRSVPEALCTAPFDSRTCMGVCMCVWRGMCVCVMCCDL